MNSVSVNVERAALARPPLSGTPDLLRANLGPSASTGAEIVDAHSRGRSLDIDGIALDLKAAIQQRPHEATRLTLQAMERLPADERDEVAQAFVQAHSDAELQTLAQTAAGKGALVLAANELGLGSVHGDEARDAARIGQALGVDLQIQANAGWAAVSGWIHTVLDLAGFIPGLGAIPDLINAGLYAAEGDMANAALSAAAAVPIAGDGVKGAAMVVKHADEVTALGAQAARRVDDVAAAVPTPGAMPDGLSYRVDLPQHLAGPHGFKGQALHGTHNLDNAVDQLQAQGIAHRLEPTGTPGILQLRYEVPKADGSFKSLSKTVYDPAVFTDARMLDIAQAAGRRGFEAVLNHPAGPSTFDFVEGGVNMRVYINKTADGIPFVGNVHPIK